MELPEELRQLTGVYKDRRERAMQTFHMNEDGLLIRTPMEPLGKKPAGKEGNQRYNIGGIPPKAAFSKKPYAHSVSLWDPVQDISEKEEWKINNGNNQQDTDGGCNVESETEMIETACSESLLKGTETTEKQSSESKPPKKDVLTLKEQFTQLLTANKEVSAMSDPSPPTVNSSPPVAVQAVVSLPSPPGETPSPTTRNITPYQNPFQLNYPRLFSPHSCKTEPNWQ